MVCLIWNRQTVSKAIFVVLVWLDISMCYLFFVKLLVDRLFICVNKIECNMVNTRMSEKCPIVVTSVQVNTLKSEAYLISILIGMGEFSPEWSLFNFALTKWDFRLRFFLNVRIGRGSSVFLKHLVLCISYQYFLITPMTLGATFENLVMNTILIEFPTLCLGFSSWDQFENFTFFTCRSMNLCEYPLFSKFTLCFSLNCKKVSNLELVLTNRFISPMMTPLLGWKDVAWI